MAWIESHQSLGGHIKLRRLARMLGINRAQAVGHLHFLWWWALDGAPSGDLSGMIPADIAELSEWPGDPDAFFGALRECGWIDPDGRIHDWMDYAGRLVDVRRKDRERKREFQRSSSGVPTESQRSSSGVPTESQRSSSGVPTESQRSSSGVPEDVHRKSNGCRQDSAVPYPTVPNRTVPNPTVPKKETPDTSPSQDSLPPASGSNGEPLLGVAVPELFSLQDLPAKATRKKHEYSPDFEQFWAAYPWKTGKDAAFQEWKKSKDRRPDPQALLSALAKQVSSFDWTKDGGKWIPKPENWIKDGRWNDEVRELAAQTSGTSHRERMDMKRLLDEEEHRLENETLSEIQRQEHPDLVSKLRDVRIRKAKLVEEMMAQA
jgi:hypothetical protein